MKYIHLQKGDSLLFPVYAVNELLVAANYFIDKQCYSECLCTHLWTHVLVFLSRSRIVWSMVIQYENIKRYYWTALLKDFFNLLFYQQYLRGNTLLRQAVLKRLETLWCMVENWTLPCFMFIFNDFTWATLFSLRILEVL